METEHGLCCLPEVVLAETIVTQPWEPLDFQVGKSNGRGDKPVAVVLLVQSEQALGQTGP